MTTTINASPTNGLVQTADGSGVLKVQSNGKTTNALAWGSYNFVGSGSTPTLRSAYNISSITRNSDGNYTFAFTTAMSDANYSAIGNAGSQNSSQLSSTTVSTGTKSTSSVQFLVGYVNSGGTVATLFDYGIDFVIFGN